MTSHIHESGWCATGIGAPMEWAERPVNAFAFHVSVGRSCDDNNASSTARAVLPHESPSGHNGNARTGAKRVTRICDGSVPEGRSM